MKFLQNINNPEVAITSLDIAEATGKLHKNVMRDIRNETKKLGELAHELFTESTYINKQNKQQPCYTLTKKGAMMLALKYDAVTRLKILDHLEKLEEENELLKYGVAEHDPIATPCFSNPAEQARVWALEQERKQLPGENTNETL